MAAGAPASTAFRAAVMIATSYLDRSTVGRLLQMALEAEIDIALLQHLRVDRAMRIMAGGAALAHCIVLEDKGALLSSMALRAGFIFAGHVRATALYRAAAVGIMTFTASHLSSQDRMRMGKMEFAALIKMALEAGLGRLRRIHDTALAAAGLHVLAARTMAGLAAHSMFLLHIRATKLRMGGSGKLGDLLSVAGCALLRAH